MDFELTEEQADIKIAAREFAEKEFTEEIVEMCDRGDFPWELYRKAGKLGFIEPYVDEKHGGQALGLLESLLICEEFCSGDSGVGCAMNGGIGTSLVHMFGTEEQKAKYLEKVCKGEGIGAGAFTEPGHGSDLLSLETTAVEDGDCYVLNGTKTLISRAEIADFTVVLCQTDLEVEPTYRGQTMFIVDREAEGLEVNRISGAMGQKVGHLSEISFDGVRVGGDAVIGVENRGFHQSMKYFNESGRPLIAARSIGMAQGAFDRALNYALERKAFGQPIANFQVIQHKFADMAMKLEAARLLVYKTAWAIDAGKPRDVTTKLSAMSKCYSSEVANEVIDEALQIFGGYGYIYEYGLEHFYRDARLLRIYEGTSEILRNILAGRLIR